MEAKIKKCIIKEIKDAEWGDDDLQVICESIIDIANMSALEILQSQGVHKYEMELHNCADNKNELSEALVGKTVSVCEYVFDVSELTDKGTKARIYDCEGEIGVSSSLTLSVPCADDFEPTESDFLKVKEILKTDLEDENGFKLIENEKHEDTVPKGPTGYLEIDGDIVKVNSIFDLKHIVEGHENFMPF